MDKSNILLFLQFFLIWFTELHLCNWSKSSCPEMFLGKGVKNWCEKLQQIYRRTPIPKCDFNKAASNFIEITLRHGCSPINLLHIFRTSFPKSASGRLLLKVLTDTDTAVIWPCFWKTSYTKFNLQIQIDTPEKPQNFCSYFIMFR